MSELITPRARADMRLHLLASVSALSLLAAALPARAEDTSRPTVWIDLGGQFERISSDEDVFAPPFLSKFEPLGFQSVIPLQQTRKNAFGEEGSISVSPRGTDWTFSASLRYGRSNGDQTFNQQRPTSVGFGNAYGHLNLAASTGNSDTYAILDFQAGKDVGLGMFGRHAESLLRLGVRFAQFTSRRHVGLDGVPDAFHSTPPHATPIAKYRLWTRHRYYGSSNIEHSFHGVGPSASWNASAPILSRDGDNGLMLDWGVNAAVLFGRQKASGQSNATGLYYHTYQRFGALGTFHARQGVASSYHHRNAINRSRSVIVPNVGGFAGFSFHYSNAKVSFGYRADAFFGAMDTGVDTRHDANTLFYGPFANISLGLGG